MAISFFLRFHSNWQ